MSRCVLAKLRQRVRHSEFLFSPLCALVVGHETRQAGADSRARFAEADRVRVHGRGIMEVIRTRARYVNTQYRWTDK